MDPLNGIRESLVAVTHKVDNGKHQLSNMRAKSEAGISKIKAKRKEIEDAIAGIKTTDGVSFDTIVSVTRNLDKLMSEVQSLMAVNHHVILLKDFLDAKVERSKQLMSSRSSKMEELRKLALAWEDQFNPNIDKKMAQLEENKKLIVEKSTILRRMESDFFNKKVSVVQKKNLIKEMNKKLEKIKAENISSKATSATSNNKRNEAWLAASQQQEELDKLICPLSDHLQIIEGSYAVLQDIQAEIEVCTNELVGQENLSEEITKEEIDLEEMLKNCSEQVAALKLGIETKTMISDGSKAEIAGYISKLSKLIEDADNNIRHLEIETAELKAASDAASLKANSTQAEYDIWKKGEQERCEEMDSDEENELDGEIADVRAEIAQLKEQLSIRGADEKAKDSESKMENEPAKMVQGQAEVKDSNELKEKGKEDFVIMENGQTVSSRQDQAIQDDKKINTEEKKEHPNILNRDIIMNALTDPWPEESETNFSQNERNFFLEPLTRNDTANDPEQASPATFNQNDSFSQSQYFVPKITAEIQIEEESLETNQNIQVKRRDSREESNVQKIIKKDEYHLSPMDNSQEMPLTPAINFYIRPQLKRTPKKVECSRSSTSSYESSYLDMMVKEKEPPVEPKAKAPQRKALFKPTVSFDPDTIEDPIKSIEDIKEERYSQRSGKTRKPSQRGRARGASKL